MQGFTSFDFSYGDLTRKVYKLGEDDKPAVLILLELPGMTKHTVKLARRLHRDGYTVYLPLLFGKPNDSYSVGKNILRICIQKEFNLLAQHKPSLVTEWLRTLSRKMQKMSGGPVGAIGMCFTGGFVLSLMIDDAIAAPVMSQPFLVGNPFIKKEKISLGLPQAEIKQAEKRSKTENVPVLGFRFTRDILFCTKSSFDAVEEILGENFIRYEIDNSLFNQYKIPLYAHSVLTIDYNDAPGHPTRRAYERLVEFFRDRLSACE